MTPLKIDYAKEDQARTVVACRLLDIEDNHENAFIPYRTGFRTAAILATRPGVTHRFQRQFERVVVKLYKGQGGDAFVREYQHYHECAFHLLASLVGNKHVQQSVTAGVQKNTVAGVTQSSWPFAIVEHIEGEELGPRLDLGDLTKRQATEILRDILGNIWIPLWASGLRFKDCHPGNLVLTPNNHVVLIDSEQMRKDAHELLNHPQQWTQRDKHQEAGLKRLPGWVTRIIRSTNTKRTKASIDRRVRHALQQTGLASELGLLGKENKSKEPATQALDAFLSNLANGELIA